MAHSLYLTPEYQHDLTVNLEAASERQPVRADVYIRDVRTLMSRYQLALTLLTDSLQHMSAEARNDFFIRHPEML